MQGHVLTMAPATWDRVWRHLLPDDTDTEQAAFLFCRYRAETSGTHFEVADVRLLEGADFESQRSDYIELSDDARIGLIKHAHATSTCLAELHSHPGPWPAAFSRADRSGLLETVPHMRWRLKGAPYLAIVVATAGYDALVWAGSNTPEPLLFIEAGDRRIPPENRSLEGWKR